MAWITVIDEEQADESLRNAYSEVGSARGVVANILKIHSLHPQVMTAHLALYRMLMFGPSELTRSEREMIAVTVSVANHCHYWIRHHGESLRALTKDDELLAALERDPANAPLEPRQQLLVHYAIKLTSAPHTVTESDIASLRNAGLSDAAIHDAAAVIAYFNFVNRMASGLGVELEGA